eukprot:m.53322 g.53322  ORF g.53322 m.53322 type:complete len:76 (-) comp12786_c0_seq1:109-336(-)
MVMHTLPSLTLRCLSVFCLHAVHDMSQSKRNNQALLLPPLFFLSSSVSFLSSCFILLWGYLKLIVFSLHHWLYFF